MGCQRLLKTDKVSACCCETLSLERGADKLFLSREIGKHGAYWALRGGGHPSMTRMAREGCLEEVTPRQGYDMIGQLEGPW